MERGEQRRRGREIAPCSELGTSIGCGCLQLVYCTPNTAMLFRAALKVKCDGLHAGVSRLTESERGTKEYVYFLGIFSVYYLQE